MEMLPPLLIAFSIGLIAWNISQRSVNRRMIAQRLHGATADAGETPAAASLVDPDQKIVLESVASDALARDLYMSGQRSVKTLLMYRRFSKLSMFIPVAFLGLFAFSGKLDAKNAMLALITGIIIFLYIRVNVGNRKKSRQAKMLRMLPQFLDLLVVCIEAGMSFPAALDRVLKEVDQNNPLTQEFRIMYNEYISGVTLAEASNRLSKRCELRDLSILLTAIVQSDATGASLGNVLRVQAVELRDKARQRLREKAYKIPILILFPSLLILSTVLIMTLGPTIFQITTVKSGPMNFGAKSAQTGVR